jgi:hypothetical protein
MSPPTTERDAAGGAAEGGRKPTAATLDVRQKVTAEVLSRCDSYDELEDGYALSYPNTRAWQERLDIFTTAWRISCPQMTFDVVSDAGADPMVMHIRGPEGTKAFVDGARYMLTSHINPAPTLKMRVEKATRFLTNPLRTLPDFLIIGAKKCGTTALYSYLTQHPCITPAFKKEIYFFNAFYRKGPGWYRAFFPTKAACKRNAVNGQKQLTGEATPDYLFHPRAASRIQGMLPDARMMAILRNPVDRAYSFYNHNLRAGLETLSFEDAIDKEEERLAGKRETILERDDYFSFEFMHYSYVARGLYIDQIEEWLQYYTRDQLLVLQNERLYTDPKQVLTEAFEHLGLAYHEPAKFKRLNAAPYYPDMDPKTRARLEELFRPYNERLYEFLGRDLEW